MRNRRDSNRCFLALCLLVFSLEFTSTVGQVADTVRLVDGNSSSEGRVEVYHDGEWGTICSDFWTAASAKVVCRQLGYGFVFSKLANFGEGSGPILLDDVWCADFHGMIEDCYHNGWGNHDCNHTQDVGVVCSEHFIYNGNTVITDERRFELNLTDSRFEASGFLVARYSPAEEWGAICGDHWDYRDAQVACRHLGFGPNIDTKARLINESDIPETTMFSAVGCLGDETELWQCELVSGAGVTCETLPYIECEAETAMFEDPINLCGQIHYCGFECHQGPRDTLRYEATETCKCDNACVYFEDCCYDYKTNCDPTPDSGGELMNGVDIRYYACVQTPGMEVVERYAHFGFALVSFCPQQWTGPDFLKLECEQMPFPLDVIASLPVFDNEGAVYKNIFCALCHGVEANEIRKWTAKLEYEDYTMPGSTYTDPRLNVTIIDGTPTGRYVVEPPEDGSGGFPRTCPVSTIGSCLQEFSNSSHEAACKEYFAPTVVNSVRYKNPHCALCNGQFAYPTDTCLSTCLPPFCVPFENWEPCYMSCTKGPPHILTVEALFDFGWGGGEKSACRSGELYDPFLDRCRGVICAAGLVLADDGQCLPLLETFFPIPPLLQSPETLNRECHSIINDSLSGSSEVVHWQLVPLNDTQSSDLSIENHTLFILGKSYETLEQDIGDFLNTFKNYNTEQSYCNLLTVTAYTLKGVELLSSIDVCANSTMNMWEVFDPSIENETLYDLKIIRSFRLSQQNSSFSREGLLPTECTDIILLNCSKMFERLTADEYVFQPVSRSIRHLPTGLAFGPGEFVTLSDRTAIICGPVAWSDPSKYALGLLSLILYCLSLLALLATFVTYCVFLTLRNMVGLQTMNLLVALFVAILLIVLAGNLSVEGTYCQAMASVIHLSWLAAFFWMATLSVNAAKTFGSRNVLPRGSPPSSRQLLTTMTLVWGTALLIVAVGLVLNFCDCTSLPAVYSESPPCWIPNVKALLVAFVAPVAASLLISVSSFIFVIVKVRKMKGESKMVQKKGNLEEVLGELKIYVKLALLFGVSWLLAFVSVAVNHVILSYTNVIVNSLQGVFIFMAFCLNQRVRALWRGRILGRGDAGGSKVSTKVSSSSKEKHAVTATHISTVSNKSPETEDIKEETYL
ncbi:uncharacterized protein LOC119724733 [Patiria miniata]|uniref:Uncharacterized protein n=1 Tax=Patiria miniata TaxID=46514 RepID=A0A913ZKK4_PATMI|nr:uncharacterized protein LOC119724733 [Patiria miniata]